MICLFLLEEYMYLNKWVFKSKDNRKIVLFVRQAVAYMSCLQGHDIFYL